MNKHCSWMYAFIASIASYFVSMILIEINNPTGWAFFASIGTIFLVLGLYFLVDLSLEYKDYTNLDADEELYYTCFDANCEHWRWTSCREPRVDIDGIEWFACDPYPTWYRYDPDEGLIVPPVDPIWPDKEKS